MKLLFEIVDNDIAVYLRVVIRKILFLTLPSVTEYCLPNHTLESKTQHCQGLKSNFIVLIKGWGEFKG